MFRYLIMTLVLAGALLTNWSAAQEVEFGFDGRVRTTGVPFNGDGLFKFAIVSKDGAVCYWSNDGVTLSGNEPTTSVHIAVSNGFFSVIIGDTDIAGMAPLDASIFNTDERVRLRVWFNDGINGFQQLSPDRPITNPSLIGLQSGSGLTIYVDPILGNDHNGGNKPHKPKKTIQAAWNALPRLLTTTATIQLASGEYYQSAVLQGKYVPGDARIVLRGNDHSSNSVRIIGAADRATSTTPTAQYTISINNQRNVALQELNIQYATSGCILIT